MLGRWPLAVRRFWCREVAVGWSAVLVAADADEPLRRRWAPRS